MTTPMPTHDHALALQMRAESDFEIVKRDAAPAYLLCLFLGGLGAHRFYLGRTGSAVAMLVIYLVSIPLMFVLIGFVTIMIPAVWAFIDLFLISGILQAENFALRARVFQRYGLDPTAPVGYYAAAGRPALGYGPAGYPATGYAQPGHAQPGYAPELPAAQVVPIQQPVQQPAQVEGAAVSMRKHGDTQ